MNICQIFIQRYVTSTSCKPILFCNSVKAMFLFWPKISTRIPFILWFEFQCLLFLKFLRVGVGWVDFKFQPRFSYICLWTLIQRVHVGIFWAIKIKCLLKKSKSCIIQNKLTRCFNFNVRNWILKLVPMYVTTSQISLYQKCTFKQTLSPRTSALLPKFRIWYVPLPW